MTRRVDMRRCIYCRERVAELPDRNRPGNLTKRVCRECHSDLLREDLINVLRVKERRRLDEDGKQGCARKD
jgi:hypothetical protein